MYTGNEALNIHGYSQEEGPKELDEFLKENYIFDDEKKLNAVLDYDGENLNKIYNQFLQKNMSDSEIARDLKKYLMENNHHEYITQDNDLPKILIQEVVEDNKDLFKQVNTEQIENLIKTFLKESSPEEAKDLIFMNLVEKKEIQDVRIVNKIDSELITIKEAIKFKKDLEKDLEDIKTSGNDILIQRTKNNAKEVLSSLSEFHGDYYNRLKQKIQSQIDYLKK